MRVEVEVTLSTIFMGKLPFLFIEDRWALVPCNFFIRVDTHYQDIAHCFGLSNLICMAKMNHIIAAITPHTGDLFTLFSLRRHNSKDLSIKVYVFKCDTSKFLQLLQLTSLQPARAKHVLVQRLLRIEGISNLQNDKWWLDSESCSCVIAFGKLD